MNLPHVRAVPKAQRSGQAPKGARHPGRSSPKGAGLEEGAQGGITQRALLAGGPGGTVRRRDTVLAGRLTEVGA